MKRQKTGLRHWVAALAFLVGFLLICAEAEDRAARQEQVQR